MRESLDRRAKRGFALMLLLAALLVRGAIPQGYMAESTAPGVLTVTICHSDAVLQVPLREQGEGPSKSADPEPQPCVFAGYGPALAADEAASLPLPAAVAEAFAKADAPFALAAAARQLPPARGPPATA
jgi:hypothetical protein